MKKLRVADLFEVYANAFRITNNRIEIKPECVSSMKEKILAIFNDNQLIKANHNYSDVLVSGWFYKIISDFSKPEENSIRLSSINENNQEVFIKIEEFFDVFANQLIIQKEDLNIVFNRFFKSAERRSVDRI